MYRLHTFKRLIQSIFSQNFTSYQSRKARIPWIKKKLIDFWPSLLSIHIYFFPFLFSSMAFITIFCLFKPDSVCIKLQDQTPLHNLRKSLHSKHPVTCKISNVYRLNGRNSLKWSQFIRTYLKGKGKLSHLLTTGPKKGDLKFDAWDEADLIIMHVLVMEFNES